MSYCTDILNLDVFDGAMRATLTYSIKQEFFSLTDDVLPVKLTISII